MRDKYNMQVVAAANVATLIGMKKKKCKYHITGPVRVDSIVKASIRILGAVAAPDRISNSFRVRIIDIEAYHHGNLAVAHDNHLLGVFLKVLSVLRVRHLNNKARILLLHYGVACIRIKLRRRLSGEIDL